MTTPITLYGTNAASVTLPSAGLLVSSTGASGNSQQTSKCGTSTGYSELYALGTANAWAAAANMNASPSGNGWLDDSTELEGTQIISGIWVPTLRAKISVGTATADMYVNIYKYNGGNFTLIGTCQLLAQSLTSTITTYAFGNTTLPATTFVTGDKLYYDVWFNLSANSSGSSTATIAVTMSNSATQGRASNVQLVTPGYNVTVTATIVLTNAGLNLLRDGLSGANTSVIKYVAIGTSNATPTVNDTQLGQEVYRKSVSSYTNGVSVGEVLINGYLAPADALNIPIAEVGFFGGATATASPNTGIMLARGLYSHTKAATAIESIQAQLDFTA